MADSIVPAVKQAAAAYIVNQAEGTISYYMEGMGAPMGSFRNYGHEARAIAIVDRSLSEVSPGVYRGRVRVPVEGIYDIAFMMDSPQFLHCFTAAVAPNEADKGANAGKVVVKYDIDSRYIVMGEPRTIRFRLEDMETGEAISNVEDVAVMYYRSDGRDRKQQQASNIGEGLYAATVEVSSLSTYYVYVSAPSRGLAFSDQPFLSLIAMPPPKKEATEAAAN